jgi:N-acetylmuramic acid 6-phosphate etherase
MAVEKAIPQIEKLVEAIVDGMLAGGRLFYAGAGTSGRLGILDASECPPTFGVDHGLVIGMIAGGDTAIRKAVEYAEDDTAQCWKDLEAYHIGPADVVVGIAASGTTPFVLGGMKACREKGIVTGGITCNTGSPLATAVDFPVEVETGPEFVTGSTRMKSGTAQKLVLNMISTSVMIRLGRVEDNRMVNMQLTNNKLVDRGVRMVMEKLGLAGYEEARTILLKSGSVKRAVEEYQAKSSGNNS